MKNIEIKCPLGDTSMMTMRLHSIGATMEWTRQQEDTFFKTTMGWLKLREAEGAKPELISYVRSTDTTVRTSEYDIAPVADPVLWKRLLNRVAPIEITVIKQRTLYLHQHTRIHLDQVQDLGSFLELETLTEDLTLDAARKETDALIHSLALDPSTFITIPYRTLLLAQGSDENS